MSNISQVKSSLCNRMNNEKDQPIIINNIIKTPVDALNKDLMEKEMKIRVLENRRSQRSQLN